MMAVLLDRRRAAAFLISALCLVSLTLSFALPARPAASAPEAVTVHITESGFDPPLSSIAAGDTVTWVNDTDRTITLREGQQILAYLPVSIRTTGPATSGSALVRHAAAPSALFNQVIQPGGKFAFKFTAVNDYYITLLEFPGIYSWISVLLPPGGQVRGHLYANMRRIDDNIPIGEVDKIYLPDVTVILRTQANVEVERVRTDLSGRFSIPHQIGGTYKICWEADGFVTGCSGAPVVLSNRGVNVGELEVFIKNATDVMVLYGRARFADSSLPRWFEPFANVNAFATVDLLVGGSAVAKTYINNFGDYLIPNAPIQKDLMVKAAIESEVAEHTIAAGATSPGAHRFDIRFLNHRPLMETVEATQGGKYARAADPGTMVDLHVEATDPDGDALSYFWILPTSSGQLSSRTGQNVVWTLPAVQALHRVEVIAFDGRGGYAKSTISVETNPEGVLFAGRVVTPANTPIAGALVDVNGVTALTNSAGYVSLRAPQADSYILDISKAGFAPLSRIYTDGQTGGVWTLTPAKVVVVDPTKPIDVRDDKPVCPGSIGQRIPWDKYPDQGIPRYQDGNGQVIAVGGMGVDFEDLTADTTYIVGETFEDSGVKGEVQTFFFAPGQPATSGFARVDDNQAAGGSGLDMQLNNVSIGFLLDKPISDMSLRFGDYGGSVNLWINGELKIVDDLVDLDGTTFNGVLIEVTATEPKAILTLTGEIEKFAIGGQEFWIDDVVFDPVSHLPRTLPCPPGLRVQIPANALEDENGNPPPGNVSVAVGTYDILSPDGMPGDYSVAGNPGDLLGMESFGAGSVQISDGTNTYQLKPGQQATLTLPVAPIHTLFSRPIPPTIPNLLYNRATGLWEEVGTWTLAGNEYVTTVSHLSEFNTDLVSTNPACIRIVSNTLPPTYRLEITIPRGPNAAPQVKSGTVDNSVPFHVVYRLPVNTPVTLVVIDATQDIPIGTFVVNSGGIQGNPTDLTPNYPYTVCQSEVVLYDPNLSDPPSLSQSPANTFLHGLTSFYATAFDEFLGSTPADSATGEAFAGATADYYEQIDPHGLRETLTEFIAENDFTTETHAIYTNSADLGFGRDMHCTRHEDTPGVYDVACYVSNYGVGYVALADGGGFGTPDTADFQTVADQYDGSVVNDVNPVATVAMEYSRVEDPINANAFINPNRIVKFYVYGADGSRVDGTDGLGNVDTGNAFVDLDGFGGRPLPQLCMVCHGGQVNFDGAPSATNPPVFDSFADVDMGSVFIPFDLNSYTFVDGYLPAFDKSAQQTEFRLLNQQIVDETDPGAPISEVIEVMYLPTGVGNQNQVFVVPGWNSDAAHIDMYERVMAPACRACHVAQVNALGPTFQTSAEAVALAGSIRQRVCVQGVMPHARATYDRFWTSVNPHQPARLISWGTVYAPGLDWAACATAGPDDAPPIPDVVFHDTDIQPIWTNNCAFGGCHAGGAPAGGMNLSAGVAYGNIVNVPAGQLNTMDRIEPLNENQSYIWHKINGTQGGVGGAGSQMPPPNGGLGATDIATILQWIQDGAAESP